MTAPTPDTWVVGDLQGCCQPLEALLTHPDIALDPRTRLWFAGDLVNRGPDSLGTLRKIIALGDRAVCILGNHDLHLLAIAAGAGRLKKADTLSDILEAPDADALIGWLRNQPLAHYGEGYLMVHAGVPPQWDTQKTLSLAAEAEAALRHDDWKQNLATMYGNQPDIWHDDLQGEDRLRAIINALTRMRMCDAQGRMNFQEKGAPFHDGHLMPWYDAPDRKLEDPVVFGHWSTLGLLMRPDAICLDTGCVWGRQLTAMRLRDRALIQVPCTRQKQPGQHSGD